jgi:predicted enzyme related to lactoylglutathione lyase
MRVTTISRVIGAADMDRARGFYEGVLGLEVTRASPEWIDFTCGDGNLAVQRHQPRGDDGEVTPTMVLLTVEGELDEAIGAVEAGGGGLLHVSDHEMAPVVVAHVTDTEGNAIQLVKVRPRP